MQDTKNNHRLQGHLLGAFSVLVWGTTFVATKVLLRTFSPIEIMVARFALGFLALLIVGRGLMRPQKKWHEALFAAAGLTGVTRKRLRIFISLRLDTAYGKPIRPPAQMAIAPVAPNVCSKKV